jgi:3-phenylpropionate/cinnamic acid dioxygenase small subunit
MEEAKGGLEERVARIEGILSQMDKRLNHLDTEVSGLRADSTQVRERVEFEDSKLG